MIYNKKPYPILIGFSKESRHLRLRGALPVAVRYANFSSPIVKQKIPIITDEDFLKKGDDILSHITAVPSAQAGLTSLFEMGRGEPRRNNHLKILRH